jgi:vesicle coat complex subunit
MTSVIRVGQSKFSAVPIDEDSQERIMNCIETLAQLQGSKVVKQVFLEDTKSAYTRMVATEEVSHRNIWDETLLIFAEEGIGQEGAGVEGYWCPGRRPDFVPSIIEKVCWRRWRGCKPAIGR